MGSITYFNFLKNVDLIIGNSSSAIIEAPSAKTIVLNIGTRQEGRLFPKCVYNCALRKNQINKSIKKLIKVKLKNYTNPFEKINTRRNLIKIIKSKINLNNIQIKKFNDLKF